MSNQEDWVRQLPGDEFLAALPGDTPEDYRMKTQVRKNCTGCHSASYPLQHRFDEEGWYKVLDLMKMVNVLGVYPRPDGKPTGNIEFHQRELAKYLARARGPGESSMKFKLRPRPSGEAARAVVKEYDFPMEGGHHRANDGSDWSLGTPSEMHHVSGVHDAQMDFNGDIWITYGHTSIDTTIAKISSKTGAVKHFKLDDQRGVATGTHGITRDENGVMWFNTRSHVSRSPWRSRPRRSQGREGPGLSAAALDHGHGRHDRRRPQRQYLGDIARRRAALRHQGGEVHRVQIGHLQGQPWHRDGLWARRRPAGQRLVAADDGRPDRLRRRQDRQDQRAPAAAGKGRASTACRPSSRKFYETFQPPDFNAPYPWAQAPRRMGADKHGDFVYTGNSFGGTLAKINIHTKETTLVPLPNPESDQPYQVAVDSGHNAWTNLWSTDKVGKYDPATNKWTLFDLPTARHRDPATSRSWSVRASRCRWSYLIRAAARLAC